MPNHLEHLNVFLLQGSQTDDKYSKRGLTLCFVGSFFDLAVACLDIPLDEPQSVVSFGSSLVYVFTPGKVV